MTGVLKKMGDLMHQNHWKLLGLYDELPMFLSLVNIFKGRGLSDSMSLPYFFNFMVVVTGCDGQVCPIHMYVYCNQNE